MKTRVKIIVEKGVELPVYATEGSSGFDIKAIGIAKMYKDDKEVDLSTMQSFLNNAQANGYFKLRVGERVLLKTGFKVQLEPGTELQIRSRSGSSLKKGLVVTNSPGTVDSKLN
jgi:dUTPase